MGNEILYGWRLSRRSKLEEMDILDDLEILPGYKAQFMPNLTGSY